MGRSIVSRLALGAGLGSACAAALAIGPHAETCYSASVPAATLTAASNTTVFTCPVEGQQTIVSLSELGYRIVHLGAVTDAGGANAKHQLLAQKEFIVLQDGFEQ